MIWIVMIITGLATFAMRFSMFSGLTNHALPAGIDRLLKYVPISVLSAIIAASVFIDADTHLPSLLNTRALAALIAAGVAYKTKSVLATIATGLGALWIIQGAFF